MSFRREPMDIYDDRGVVIVDGEKFVFVSPRDAREEIELDPDNVLLVRAAMIYLEEIEK